MIDTLTEKAELTETALMSSNLAWRQFITDHIFQLRKTASTEQLDINALHKYRYRPQYLIHEHQISLDDAWIVLLMNNIPLTTGIPLHVTELKIPEINELQILKDQFTAFVTM